MTTLTAARLRELLHYDPETGIFTTLPRGRGVKPGVRAGSTNQNGYVVIRLDGRDYRAHRLAWLYMTGEWPAQDIDHKNRQRDDNRFDNLRPATGSQNCANMLPSRPSASGHKGVYWAPHANMWRAELTLRRDGRRVKKVLGYFVDPQLAAEFRELAGDLVWGEFYRAAA